MYLVNQDIKTDTGIDKHCNLVYDRRYDILFLMNMHIFELCNKFQHTK